MISPQLDGITHINIYSKAKTELGLLLSNFAHTPVIIEYFGSFQSLEGFWFWLGTRDDKLRELYGYEAKKIGTVLSMKNRIQVDNFQDIFELGMRAKVEQHQKIHDLLKDSTLPFEHYYAYGNKVVDAGFKWLIYKWEKIRKEIKEEV